MTRLRVAFAMSAPSLARIFPPERIAGVAEACDVVGHVEEFTSPDARAILADVDALITGWGSPVVDASVLDAAPRLRAIVHSAGTVKPYITADVLRRGVQVSSMAAANALPVAEFTVAMIVLANKRILPIAARYRADRTEFDIEDGFPSLGNFDKTVGIVGASKIGRAVIERLRDFALDVVVYDPFLDDAEAASLGVRAVSLRELLATSDVVSVHAPSLPSTRGMIDADGIALMREGSTLINTARGELIDQDALTHRVLAGELYAILDVTVPWILDADHPLYESDRVLLTPHVAGSFGTELGRLAECVQEELERLSRGEDLSHAIEPDLLGITA